MLVENKRQIENRPISLEDEIKQHLVIWQSDADFNKMHLMIKKSVLYLLDTIQTTQSVKDMVDMEVDAKNEKNIEMRRFIAIYKKKYMEMTDMECDEAIDGTTCVILKSVCKQLIDQSSNVSEFLTWVFDDYYKRPEMEKHMPPCIKFTVGKMTMKKFFYEHRDKLKIRKKDLGESEQRLELMKIAVELYKEVPNPELQDVLSQISKNKISLTKAKNFLEELAKNNGKESIISKLQNIGN